jgi:hypothetical protein
MKKLAIFLAGLCFLATLAFFGCKKELSDPSLTAMRLQLRRWTRLNLTAQLLQVRPLMLRYVPVLPVRLQVSPSNGKLWQIIKKDLMGCLALQMIIHGHLPLPVIAVLPYPVRLLVTDLTGTI